MNLPWLASQLRKYADRIDHAGAPKLTHLTFTFEDYRGMVIREDGRGCRIAYLGDEEYRKAHSEAGDITKEWPGPRPPRFARGGIVASAPPPGQFCDHPPALRQATRAGGCGVCGAPIPGPRSCAEGIATFTFAVGSYSYDDDVTPGVIQPLYEEGR